MIFDNEIPSEPHQRNPPGFSIYTLADCISRIFHSANDLTVIAMAITVACGPRNW